MRTPGQSIVESVEEEGVVTVSAGHATHPRNIGHGSRGGRGGREVDDPLTVWSGTRDPLTAALADEETVAGTPHILPTWGSVPDRRGLVTRVTLDHMLVLLARNINGGAAHSAVDHGCSSRYGVVGWRHLIWTNR